MSPGSGASTRLHNHGCTDVDGCTASPGVEWNKHRNIASTGWLELPCHTRHCYLPELQTP